MTINDLIALTGLTTNDEIPVWDAEATTEEPTKKITAQLLAAGLALINGNILLGSTSTILWIK